jgi:hypothetical protein
MRLVERSKVAGGMDGMSVVLSTASDMPFVGSRIRTQTDQMKKERTTPLRTTKMTCQTTSTSL